MSGTNGNVPPASNLAGSGSSLGSINPNQQQFMHQHIQAMQQQLAMMRRQQPQAPQQPPMTQTGQGMRPPSQQEQPDNMMGGMNGVLAQVHHLQQQQQQQQQQMTGVNPWIYPNAVNVGNLAGAAASNPASFSSDILQAVNPQPNANAMALPGADSSVKSGIVDPSSGNNLLLLQYQLQRLQQMQQQHQKNQQQQQPPTTLPRSMLTTIPAGVQPQQTAHQQGSGGLPNPMGGMFQPSSFNAPLTQNSLNPMATMQHNLNFQQSTQPVGSTNQLPYQQFHQPQQQGMLLHQKHDQMSTLMNTDSNSNTQIPYSNNSFGSYDQVQQQHFTSHNAIPQVPSSNNFQLQLMQQQQQQHQFYPVQQQFLQQHQQQPLPHQMSSGSSGTPNIAALSQQPVVSSSNVGDYTAIDSRNASQQNFNSYLFNNNNVNMMPALGRDAAVDDTIKVTQPVPSNSAITPNDHLTPQDHLNRSATFLSGVGSNDSPVPSSALAGQQAGENFLGSSDVSVSLPEFNGGWQSNADLPDRRDMIVKIVKIIEKIGPDANKLAIRVPLMAKKLEKHLYRSAATKAQYTDMSTLKRRLQGIAQRLGLAKSLRKDEESQESTIDSQDNSSILMDQHLDTVQSSSVAQVGNNLNMQGSAESSFLHNEFANQNASDPTFPGKRSEAVLKLNSLQRDLCHQGLGNNSMALSGTQKEAMMQQLDSQQRHLQALISQVGHSSGMAELIEMSRIVGQQKQQIINMPGWAVTGPSGNESNLNSGPAIQNQVAANQSLPQLSLLPNFPQNLPTVGEAAHQSSFSTSCALAASNNPHAPGASNLSAVLSQAPQALLPISGDGNDARAQREKVVRQQQQRLLLLRHASKCTAGAACKTKFCPKMVELWRHMKQCRDKNCQTAHCLSSRCVLHHYRICKAENRTATCEVCSTVLNNGKSFVSGKDNLDEHGRTVDLMEQLAIEHAEQDELDDSSLMKSTQNIVSYSQDSDGLAFDTSQYQSQMQALMQQQTQTAVAASNSGALNTMFPFQALQGNTITSQQFQQHQHALSSQTTQNLQQLSGINIPLSIQQQQKQQAILLQMQAHQQKFLMQLQSKNSAPGTQPSEEALLSTNAVGNNISNTVSPENLELCPSPETAEDKVAVEAMPKGRRNSTGSVKRKSCVSHDSVPKKATKNAAGMKSKRSSKQLKSSIDVEDEHNNSDKGSSSRKTPDPKQVLDSISHDDSETVREEASEMQTRNVSSPNPRGPSDIESIHDTNGKISKNLSIPAPISDSPALVSGLTSNDETSSASNGEPIITSLLSNMSTDDIQRHLDSLNDNFNLSGRRIAQKCLPILNKLLNDQNGWIFKDPVDPVELGVPDYFEIVKHPMDLGQVKKRLENCFYKELSSFESDVKLVFDNCILYNGEDSDVGSVACALKNQFSAEYQAMLKVTKVEHRHSRKGKTCALCTVSRKFFEPSVLYCRGACCGERIRRNASYYTDSGRQNSWCTSCYDKLKESDSIILDDGVELKKKDLVKEKNDALAEEEWIECTCCKMWVHQICGLFDGQVRANASVFVCPSCVIKSRKEAPQPFVVTRSPQVATDVPHCTMSESIEKGLYYALQKEYEKKAKELNIPVDNVVKANNLYVRVVSSSEKKHTVRGEMFERYQSCGYPKEFTVRTKCILLFQTIHGVDVIIFGMYVYEYDHNCPAPNRRRVYISYLDSVNYFQPSEYRTYTYHAILIEYLRYVKNRGFHTAHIWACPPSKGDDFILHVHPPNQKTLRDDMLCNWYHSLLATAESEGVVVKTKTLYDEYFKPEEGKVFSNPTSIPYFDGDYIPGEIENIIEDLNKDDIKRCKKKENDANLTGVVPRVKNAGDKPVGNKRGTRSNPDLVLLEPDLVMKRLGHSLSQIKRNFFVVYLRSRSFADAVDKGIDVSDWTDEDDQELTDQSGYIVGKDASILGHKVIRGKRNSSFVVSDNSADTCQTMPDVCNTSFGLSASNPLSLAKANLGSTIDVDPLIHNEIFETRQQFLNFCQSNHYQFDELRRAKHTTMMILQHIRSSSSSRFLQSCEKCNSESKDGICASCRGAGNEKAKLSSSTKAAEREKTIKLHLDLLYHCATCQGRPHCALLNCSRMRDLLAHIKTCEMTYRQGCKICSRVISLLSMHARQCKVQRGEHCPVPHCNKIRERNHRIQQQQQQMDDRRRRELNALYSETPSA